MKTKKYLAIAFALALCFTVLLTGCTTTPPGSPQATAEPKAEVPDIPPAPKEAAPVETSAPSDQTSNESKPYDTRFITATAEKNTTGKEIRIACIGWENNPWWVLVKNGFAQAEKDLKAENCTVDWIVPGETLDAAKHIAAIETCVAQQYNAIVTPIYEDGVVPALKKAAEAGIPVFTVNAEPETTADSGRIAFYGSAMPYGGNDAADFILKMLNGKGKVGIITGSFGVASHESRRLAVVDALKTKAPEVEIVGEYEGQDKADITYNYAKDMITANPDLSVIYCCAGGPFGAGQAVEEMKSDCKVVCFDATVENAKYIRSGSIVAAFFDSPFASTYDGIVAAYNYAVSGTKPAEARNLAAWYLLDKSNVDIVVPS